MGIPIPRPDPDPLPLHKGYFCAHVSPNEVGSYSVDVFVRQQRDAAAAFTPLVSVDAGMLQPAWAGQRLHWLSGASNQGGAFFRVHSCGQLEYLGTAAHPSPGHLDFPGGTSTAAGRPISPGYVHYVPAEDADDDSADEEGYHDAPAVYLGGEPPLASADRPSCLHCRGPMQFIGTHSESPLAAYPPLLPRDSANKACMPPYTVLPSRFPARTPLPSPESSLEAGHTSCCSHIKHVSLNMY